VGSFPPCLDAAGYRVQANLNGGEENLGDILDDLDIPPTIFFAARDILL
jgi:hypothetical protein